MIIGFTGTRKGITIQQFQAISFIFDDSAPFEFHHGDCIGADQQAGDLAKLHGCNWLVIHPPTQSKYRAYCAGDVMLPEKPYIVRDHDIVDACQMMLATPKGFKEELRSGTWATIRYSKKIERNITIVFPDGSTEELNKNDLTF